MGINDFDGKLQLRVIELRGQSYPDLAPWPLVSIISLPLALLQIDTEKSQFEVNISVPIDFSTIVNDVLE